MTRVHTVNPATGEVIAEYPLHSQEEIDIRISQLVRSQSRWQRESIGDRAEAIKQIAQRLRDESSRWALRMTREMGKPITQSMAEIKKCAWLCDHYADHADDYLRPQQIHTDASLSYISYEPLGVILLVMPWNYPFWQVIRAAVPILLSGNTVLLKHASNVTGSSLDLEELFSGIYSESILRSVIVPGSGVRKLILHPDIKGVSLTGSETAGKSVAAAAGSALKPAVLELGGSDPYVILSDADVDLAVEQGFMGRVKNAGQSCIAAKRYIVHTDHYDSFIDRLHSMIMDIQLLHPEDQRSEMGPMARKDLAVELWEQVQSSIDAGAWCVRRGGLLDRPGAWYEPTLLADVTEDMRCFQEETFGPLFCVIRAESDEDALRLANKTPFGLGAAVFSRDLDRAERIARRQLQAGSCFVNAYVRSDPRLPFGGIGQSGYGREMGVDGIRAFTNIKTVYIA